MHFHYRDAQDILADTELAPDVEEVVKMSVLTPYTMPRRLLYCYTLNPLPPEKYKSYTKTVSGENASAKCTLRMVI